MQEGGLRRSSARPQLRSEAGEEVTGLGVPGGTQLAAQIRWRDCISRSPGLTGSQVLPIAVLMLLPGLCTPVCLLGS